LQCKIIIDFLLKFEFTRELLKKTSKFKKSKGMDVYVIKRPDTKATKVAQSKQSSLHTKVKQAGKLKK